MITKIIILTVLIIVVSKLTFEALDMLPKKTKAGKITVIASGALIVTGLIWLIAEVILGE